MEQSAVPKASFCLVEAWDLVVNHHCLQEIYHLSLKIGLNTTKRKRPRLPIFHFSGALKCWFPAGVVVIQVRQSYTLKPWKFWSFVREAYGLLLGAVGGKQQFLGLFPHLRIPFHTGYPMLAHHKHNKYNKPSEVLPHNIWMPNVILVWSSKPIFLDKLYKYLINVYRYIYIHLYTYIHMKCIERERDNNVYPSVAPLNPRTFHQSLHQSLENCRWRLICRWLSRNTEPHPEVHGYIYIYI